MQHIYPFAALTSSPKPLGNFLWAAWILAVGAMVVIGTTPISAPACYLLLGRTRLEAIRAPIEKHLGQCLVMGIATVTALYAIVSTLSLLALPGRILSVGFSALFWLMLILGYSGITVWITDKARGERATLAWVFLGGWLVAILQVIPLVGILFVAWFTLLGTGSVVVAIFGKNQAGRQAISRPGSPSKPTT